MLNPVYVPDLPRLGCRKVTFLRFLTLAGVYAPDTKRKEEVA